MLPLVVLFLIALLQSILAQEDQRQTATSDQQSTSERDQTETPARGQQDTPTREKEAAPRRDEPSAGQREQRQPAPATPRSSSALNPMSFANLFALRDGISYTLSSGQVLSCPYVSTPASPAIQPNWKCPPGSFCYCPTCRTECQDAFYCPGNTAQPLFCCPGFYCPAPAEIKVCPKGHFCPIGSTAPIECSPFLSWCDEGSAEPQRLLVFIPLSGMISLILLVFAYKGWRDRRRRSRDSLRMLEIQRRKVQAKEVEWKPPRESPAMGLMPSAGESSLHEKNAFSIYERGSTAGFGSGLGVVHVNPMMLHGNGRASPPPPYGPESPLSPRSPLGGPLSPCSPLSPSVSVRGPSKLRINTDEDQSSHSLTPAYGPAVTITFKNIGLRIAQNDILKSISGNLRPSRLLAILGPSGSGKSTFLSILRRSPRHAVGTVAINDKPSKLHKYKSLVGFVPQDDILIPELSPRAILMHSAKTRLPKAIPGEEKRRLVMQTIDFLGLKDVMDHPVGDANNPSLSGGQRKRVNIGVELVADPKVLLLDEPTSGLDSSTATEICQMLQRVAREKQMTIATVIHSPSERAFQCFDDLLVLTHGGRVAYHGARLHLKKYLTDMGFARGFEASENECEYLMDVISGRALCSCNPGFQIEDFAKCWERFNRAGPSSPVDKEAPPISGWINDGEDTAGRSGDLNPVAQFILFIGDSFIDICHLIVDLAQEFGSWFTSWFTTAEGVRRTPNPIVMYHLHLKRAFLQLLRSTLSLFVTLLVHAGTGLFVSLAIQNLTYIGRQPEEICQVAPAALQETCRKPADSVQFAGLFISLGVLYSGVTAGTSTFLPEQLNFYRETSRGMALTPYFLAKVTTDAVRIILASGSFAVGLVVFWAYRSHFYLIWGVVALLYASAFAMGYFISAIATRSNVHLVGSAFALATSLVFSGVIPDLLQVQSESSPLNYVSFLWTISGPRHAIELLYMYEVGGRDFEEVNTGNVGGEFGYEDGMSGWTYMIGIVVGWLLISWFSMKVMRRELQK